MKTEVDQVKNVERVNKEGIENTKRVPLTKKQIDIFTKAVTDSQKYQEELRKTKEKENELLTIILEFANIDSTKITNIKLSETNDALVIEFIPQPKLEPILDTKEVPKNVVKDTKSK